MWRSRRCPSGRWCGAAGGLSLVGEGFPFGAAVVAAGVAVGVGFGLLFGVLAAGFGCHEVEESVSGYEVCGCQLGLLFAVPADIRMIAQ